MRNPCVELEKTDTTVRCFNIIGDKEKITTPSMLTKEKNSLMLFERFTEEDTEGEKITISEERICHLPHLLPDFRKNTVRQRVKDLTVDMEEDVISLSYYPDPYVFRPLEKQDVKILFIKDVSSKVRFRALFDFLIGLRDIFPLDTAFAFLSPTDVELLPFLIYLGVDVVNIDPFFLRIWKEEERALLQNLYFGWNVGVKKLLYSKREEIHSLLRKYNKRYLNLLFKTLRRVTNKGKFRNFIEMWSHTSHQANASLNILDHGRRKFFTTYVPLEKAIEYDFIGAEAFQRPIVSLYARRLTQHYVPPSSKIVLFLPCAAKKPYSDSPSHRQFINAIRSGAGPARYKIHEVMITSPFGIVPRELEASPPGVNYEITVTGHWSERELAHTADLVKCYLKKQKKRNDDLHILVHLEGGYLQAVKRALEDTGLDYAVTSKGHPRNQNSLHSLQNKLKEVIDRDVNLTELRQRSRETIRSVLSYQFDGHIAEKMVEGRRAAGKPRTERWRLSETVQFFPEIGFFVPLLKGAELLSNTGWAVDLNKHPKDRLLQGNLVEKTRRNLHSGEVFIGRVHKRPVLVAQALVPSAKMRNARKLNIGKILKRY